MGRGEPLGTGEGGDSYTQALKPNERTRSIKKKVMSQKKSGKRRADMLEHGRGSIRKEIG